MSLKLKVLGLGLLAVLAMSAVAVMNASARTSGHFVSDSPNGKTTIVGSETPTHFTELTSHGIAGGIVCDEVAYHGTIGHTPPPTTNTSTHIDIKPTYNKCHTTGETPGTVTVTMNGCSYTFTPGANGTVHLDCPAGAAVEIHHHNCTITIKPPITVQGATYETDVDANGKHIITLKLHTVEFPTQYHGGICIFTGTNHSGTLSGSVTVRGFQDETTAAGPQVNITHTP